MSDEPMRLITLSHAPFQSNRLKEGLDAALVAAAFGQAVKLLFLGQGALALIKDQASGAPGQKAVLPTISMLEMYDIEELLVPRESLKAWGIEPEQLIASATVITQETLGELYQRSINILHF
ncbi:DsrE family protein [Vreelandella sp. EE22]